MNISLRWLNWYLAPGGLSAQEAEHILTEAGFPLESVTPQPDGDTLLDVEVTSNRVDCLSHIGCAREIAAGSLRPGASAVRTLKLPQTPEPVSGSAIAADLRLINDVPEHCPHFTAYLIRGVKIGPSPDWLRGALESIGARSINNVVDVTNFITFELGNPCHVFDAGKLAGPTLHVRFAKTGETCKTLYAGEHRLRETDLVVADGQHPQSLAGVIGGFDSQVDAGTTDVVFEMATWHPVTVRNTARRLNIATDAAARFQRGIDPRTIPAAARRGVGLIAQVSGGTVASGHLEAGRPARPLTRVELRPSRCRHVLGVETPEGDIRRLLGALEIAAEPFGPDLLVCTIPAHRAGDLTREIDLIEEVVRARGLGVVPVPERLSVAVLPPQNSERAMRAIAGVLTAQGFAETVTFSFTTPAHAKDFLPEGVAPIAVDDSRRAADGTLRPSVLTGLLACRRVNQDARVSVSGGVRLFETAAVFAQVAATRATHEKRTLGLLLDVPGTGTKRTLDDRQQGLRLMRGVVDAVARCCAGAGDVVEIEDGAGKPTPSPAWDAGAFASLTLRGTGVTGGRVPLGHFGLVSSATLRAHGLDVPVVAAELDLAPLLAAYPPRGSARALPQFPGIERDVSLVVAETVRWSQIDALVRALRLELLEAHEMVGVFRGAQTGAGRKSVTVRLHFRDPARTLRHEEVDPQVARLIEGAGASLGAQVRTAGA